MVWYLQGNRTTGAAKLEFLAQFSGSPGIIAKGLGDTDETCNLGLPPEQYSDSSDEPEAKRRASIEESSFSSESEHAREAPGSFGLDLADVTVAETGFNPAFGFGDASKCVVYSFLFLPSPDTLSTLTPIQT
jgi:hypothetical protein